MSKYIKPPASHECKWRSGPPPSVGWWPASRFGWVDMLRFWDGANWSLAATDEATSKDAAEKAKIGAGYNSDIQWTDRWWLKGGEA